MRPRARSCGVNLAALLTALCIPVVARAQDSSSTAPQTANECLRFAFGEWSTPLDWRAAGHRDPSLAPDSAAQSRVNASRSGTEHPGDVLLFPPWWPVGVYVQLDTAHSVGDTIRGTATALVANGQAKVPTAKVMALRVPCGQHVAPPSYVPPANIAPKKPSTRRRHASRPAHAPSTSR